MTAESNVRIMEVVPHNPKWKADFLTEAEVIRYVLKEEVIGIRTILVALQYLESMQSPSLISWSKLRILLKLTSIMKILRKQDI